MHRIRCFRTFIRHFVSLEEGKLLLVICFLIVVVKMCFIPKMYHPVFHSGVPNLYLDMLERLQKQVRGIVITTLSASHEPVAHF